MKVIRDDELQAFLLLSSLPDSWDTLVVSLNNSAPNAQLTMDMVKDSLLNEEANRKESGTTSADGDALVSGRKDKQGRSQSRDSHPNFNKGQSRGKSQSRKDKQCYHCKTFGHLRRVWAVQKGTEKEQRCRKETGTEKDYCSCS